MLKFFIMHVVLKKVCKCLCMGVCMNMSPSPTRKEAGIQVEKNHLKEPTLKTIWPASLVPSELNERANAPSLS